MNSQTIKPHDLNVSPDLSSARFIVQSCSQEIGHEEAIYRRADHRLPEGR